jgi:cytochrome c556
LKKKTVMCLSVFWLIAFALSGSQGQTTEKDSPLQLLPSTLDSLYPPKAQQPVFLMKMLDLSHLFTGIVVDLLEEDFSNVWSSYEKFKEDYLDFSKLVPEWETKYPLSPVEELGKALKAGEKTGIMAAYEKVGNICYACHIESMAAVKYKYHWKDFRPIRIKDPLTNDEIDFVQLMRMLDVNFTGMTHDLEQGQMERVDENSRAFLARFRALGETCQECHGTSERRYYVDDSIQQMIMNLNKALTSSQADLKDIPNRIMAIGMESCFNCHLVHIPASYARYQWKR